MNLKDKTTVITGASDGLGKQIAFKLAQEQVNLALISRNKTKLNQVKSKTQSLGAKQVNIYPCDIRDTQQLAKIVKSIISHFKQINILINNAGIWQKLAPIEKIKPEVVDDVIQTNLTALIHSTRLFLPYLKKQKPAAIINISSKSGHTAQEGQTVYTASKWGVRGFTENLKTDLKNSHVRVAGIYQSGTNTKMFKTAGDNFPTNKFTNPADLAEVVVYILSLPKKIWLHEVRVEY